MTNLWATFVLLTVVLVWGVCKGSKELSTAKMRCRVTNENTGVDAMLSCPGACFTLNVKNSSANKTIRGCSHRSPVQINCSNMEENKAYNNETHEWRCCRTDLCNKPDLISFPSTLQCNNISAGVVQGVVSCLGHCFISKMSNAEENIFEGNCMDKKSPTWDRLPDCSALNASCINVSTGDIVCCCTTHKCNVKEIVKIEADSRRCLVTNENTDEHTVVTCPNPCFTMKSESKVVRGCISQMPVNLDCSNVDENIPQGNNTYQWSCCLKDLCNKPKALTVSPPMLRCNKISASVLKGVVSCLGHCFISKLIDDDIFEGNCMNEKPAGWARLPECSKEKKVDCVQDYSTNSIVCCCTTDRCNVKGIVKRPSAQKLRHCMMTNENSMTDYSFKCSGGCITANVTLENKTVTIRGCDDPYWGDRRLSCDDVEEGGCRSNETHSWCCCFTNGCNTAPSTPPVQQLFCNNIRSNDSAGAVPCKANTTYCYIERTADSLGVRFNGQCMPSDTEQWPAFRYCSNRANKCVDQSPTITICCCNTNMCNTADLFRTSPPSVVFSTNDEFSTDSTSTQESSTNEDTGSEPASGELSSDTSNVSSASTTASQSAETLEDSGSSLLSVSTAPSPTTKSTSKTALVTGGGGGDPITGSASSSATASTGRNSSDGGSDASVTIQSQGSDYVTSSQQTETGKASSSVPDAPSPVPIVGNNSTAATKAISEDKGIPLWTVVLFGLLTLCIIVMAAIFGTVAKKCTIH